LLMARLPHRPAVFPYTPLFRSDVHIYHAEQDGVPVYFLESWPFFGEGGSIYTDINWDRERFIFFAQAAMGAVWELGQGRDRGARSEEHTSELQSRENLVCRLLL